VGEPFHQHVVVSQLGNVLILEHYGFGSELLSCLLFDAAMDYAV